MQDLIWSPTPAVSGRARVTAFMREQGIEDWHELHRRAQDDIGWFWDALVSHLGIEFSTSYEQIYDDSAGPMWTTWFRGGRLKPTHKRVGRPPRGPPRRIAALWGGGGGRGRNGPHSELRAEGQPLRAPPPRARGETG